MSGKPMAPRLRALSAFLFGSRDMAATDFEDIGGSIVLTFGETGAAVRVPIRVDTSGRLTLDPTSAAGVALGNAAMAASIPVTIASDDTIPTAIQTALELLDNAISGTEMQVDVVSIAANNGVDIGDVDVTSITAGETHVGEVGGNSSVFEVTLSLDTNAYASGDVLADTQAMTACMRVDAGTAVVHSITLLDEDDQAQALDLLFLRTNVSIGTENSAVSVTDANAREIMGVVEVAAADYVDLVGSQIVTKTNVGIVVDAAAGADDLYVAAISRGTGTYTASGIRLMVGLLRD